MKSIIIILVILVFLFVSSYLMSDYIIKSSKIVDSELIKLDSVVRSKDWNAASYNLVSTENKWKDIKDKWALLVDHQEIDNIDLSMSKMKEFVKGRNLTDSLAEISSLKLLFEHIPKRDSLSWVNIL